MAETYFYIRISTEDQNPARQEVIAAQYNIPATNVYIEKVSGKNIKDRKILQDLMVKLQRDDTLIVESISRFARNTRDLLNLIEELKTRGVKFISTKEQIDTSTPAGKFMLTVFSAVAEMERDYILERQREGIAVAKAAGKYKGRKPVEYPKDWKKYYSLYRRKEIKAVVMMRILNLMKTTFYKLLKEYEKMLNDL